MKSTNECRSSFTPVLVAIVLVSMSGATGDKTYHGLQTLPRRTGEEISTTVPLFPDKEVSAPEHIRLENNKDIRINLI